MPKDAWNLRYADVIGICRLAYKGRSKRQTNYLLAGRKWRVEGIFSNGGFHAATVEGKDTRDNIVKILAYSGSDPELNDWLMQGNLGNFIKGSSDTQQYINGLSLARMGEKPDYVIGHSLGGGLALYASVTESIRAITVNPSPIFGYEFGKYSDNYPWAINYCVDGEMLAAGRNGGRIWGMAGYTPGERVSVGSGGATSYHMHLLSYLYEFTEPIETQR